MLFGALIDSGSRASLFGGYLHRCSLDGACCRCDVALGRRGRAQAARRGRAAAGFQGLMEFPGAMSPPSITCA